MNNVVSRVDNGMACRRTGYDRYDICTNAIVSTTQMPWQRKTKKKQMKKLGAVRCGIDQRGRGFHTVRGGIDPGDLSYRLRVVGVVEICKDSHPGMRPCPPRERRDLGGVQLAWSERVCYLAGYITRYGIIPVRRHFYFWLAVLPPQQETIIMHCDCLHTAVLKYTCIYAQWATNGQCVCVFFLPVDIQHTRCPCWFLTLFSNRDKRAVAIKLRYTGMYSREYLVHRNAVKGDRLLINSRQCNATPSSYNGWQVVVRGTSLQSYTWYEVMGIISYTPSIHHIIRMDIIYQVCGTGKWYPPPVQRSFGGRSRSQEPFSDCSYTRKIQNIYKYEY